MEDIMFSLRNMDGQELLERFEQQVATDRETTANLLAYIAEIDARRLWAEQACSSMFAWCVQRFHMSEAVAGKRIRAARVARKFPVILEMVARGELHLTAWALGGNNTVDNIRLLCRGHNAHEACRDYGEEFMEMKRSPSKVCESVTSYRRFAPGHAMSRPRGLYRVLESGASRASVACLNSTCGPPPRSGAVKHRRERIRK